MLPQLVTPTPEQRAQGRLDRVLAEPRGPSRGGGVPLRSELLEQNKALLEENGALRRELEEMGEANSQLRLQLADFQQRQASVNCSPLATAKQLVADRKAAFEDIKARWTPLGVTQPSDA